MSDPKLEALTKGFIAAGEPEDQILRLVEENYNTARLIGDGEGGVQAEIRRADGSYATPATAKYLDNYTPVDDATRARRMGEWIRLREAGVVDPGAVMREPAPPAELEPPAPPPGPKKPHEMSTAEYMAAARDRRNAVAAPLTNPRPDVPDHKLTTEEYVHRQRWKRANGGRTLV